MTVDPGKQPDVFDPEFWRVRIEDSQGQINKAVLYTNPWAFAEIEAVHKAILADYIKPADSILDVGCAYGRLLGMMPVGWQGDYLGIDISPDFVELAYQQHPRNAFCVMDFRHALHGANKANGGYPFDWAVCIGIKEMILKYASEHEWLCVLYNLQQVSNAVLVLSLEEPHKDEVVR